MQRSIICQYKKANIKIIQFSFSEKSQIRYRFIIWKLSLIRLSI